MCLSDRRMNVWLSELTGEYISVCLNERKGECVVE